MSNVCAETRREVGVSITKKLFFCSVTADCVSLGHWDDKRDNVGAGRQTDREHLSTRL